jgi:hypothetical protein
MCNPTLISALEARLMALYLKLRNANASERNLINAMYNRVYSELTVLRSQK